MTNKKRCKKNSQENFSSRLPRFLYRFYKYEFFEEFIRTQKIYLSELNKINDEHDCSGQINYKNAPLGQLEKLIEFLVKQDSVEKNIGFPAGNLKDIARQLKQNPNEQSELNKLLQNYNKERETLGIFCLFGKKKAYPHSSSKCNEGLMRRQKVKAFSGAVI